MQRITFTAPCSASAQAVAAFAKACDAKTYIIDACSVEARCVSNNHTRNLLQTVNAMLAGLNITYTVEGR